MSYYEGAAGGTEVRKGLETLAKATKDAAEVKAKAITDDSILDGKSANANRVADTRMRSIELAFKVYKDDAAVFGFDDVLRLADRIARFVGDGEPVQDGADSFRFFGRK